MAGCSQAQTKFGAGWADAEDAMGIEPWLCGNVQVVPEGVQTPDSWTEKRKCFDSYQSTGNGPKNFLDLFSYIPYPLLFCPLLRCRLVLRVRHHHAIQIRHLSKARSGQPDISWMRISDFPSLRPQQQRDGLNIFSDSMRGHRETKVQLGPSGWLRWKKRNGLVLGLVDQRGDKNRRGWQLIGPMGQ